MNQSTSTGNEASSAPPQVWAALDLGSNSFHLLLAQSLGASFVVKERLKEKVQLLSGFSDGLIQDDAQARGLACLARFAQRLSAIERENIVVMGTCALRQADNAGDFIAAAQEILQTPVQIIAGEYEAQLIYGGVSHQVGRTAGSRLVIDIGGGSTELAAGSSTQADHALSINMGCVAYKDLYFGDSVMQASGYAAAKTAARAALQQHLDESELALLLDQWMGHRVFGTSGTVESIQTVLNANGWSRGDITREAMQRLETAIVEDRWVIEAGLPGLAPDRADIFPAGVAILNACFEVLDIEQCDYVDVSLLQGIIGEKLVTDTQADLREDSVAQLARRFDAEPTQADRVSRCAASLYAQSYAQSGGWWKEDGYADLLRWAAQLHELGVHINARHYHRHGAYIVKHAELPGFSHHQQSVLALLIRGHRRSMPGLAFRAFDPALAHNLLRLVALLRLAVILERSHNDADSPAVTLTVDDDRLTLDCGPGWLAAHPLSHRELQVEQEQQASAGIKLILIDAPEL